MLSAGADFALHPIEGLCQQGGALTKTCFNWLAVISCNCALSCNWPVPHEMACARGASALQSNSSWLVKSADWLERSAFVAVNAAAVRVCLHVEK